MKKFNIIIRENEGEFFAFCEEAEGVVFGKKIPDVLREISKIIERSMTEVEEKENSSLSQNPVKEVKSVENLYQDKTQKLYEPEAAKFLGIGRTTLRIIRAKQLIGYHRYKNKSYYSIQQLEDYQNRHEVKPISSRQPLRPVK